MTNRIDHAARYPEMRRLVTYLVRHLRGDLATFVELDAEKPFGVRWLHRRSQ